MASFVTFEALEVRHNKGVCLYHLALERGVHLRSYGLECDDGGGGSVGGGRVGP